MSKQTKTSNPRVINGVVVSAKADKTISVRVDRIFRHPLYGKTVRTSRNIQVHDEENSCKEGDQVSAVECRPLSKTKSFTLREITRVSPEEA